MTLTRPGVPRVMRVFLSSTFIDMQEEREILVKQVFPALRDRCEERGVVWGEVDLRWGITDEEAAEDRVLELCLDEIRACRPFFVGLLGERYGWVPDTLDASLLAREPWLRDYVGASVTELEIVHGVLADPSLAGNACFYLRDPAYAVGRSGFEEMPSTFEVEQWGAVTAAARADERRTRLRLLKERIRAAGIAVHEGYRDPEELTELVLRDLTALVDRCFPRASTPSFVQRERALHHSFVQSRAGVYVARESRFERLNAHAVQGGVLAVVGPAGVGKSALLANWVDRVRSHESTAPGELTAAPVIAHFVAAASTAPTWTTMLRRLIAELGELLDAPPELPEDRGRLRTRFAETLQRASVRGRLVLVIDALDQLGKGDGAQELTWLPTMLPENVSVIVSTLPGPALDELARRNALFLEVGPLCPDERRELLVHHLRAYGKKLPDRLAERIVSAPQTDSPLFLRVLLEELRLYGDHESLERRLDGLLSADGIPSLYDRVLERWETDYERMRPGLVRDVMTLLWGARRGLSEAELLDLLQGEGGPLPRAAWSRLYLAAKPMLVDREGLLGFAHRYGREAVGRRYLSSNGAGAQTHRRLARYFLRDPTRQRALLEGPWQLMHAEDWSELASLLSRPAFASTLASAARSDLHTYWATLEARATFRVADAYAAVARSPEAWGDEELLAVAQLLLDMGHAPMASTLFHQLECRCTDPDDRQSMLGWQAVALSNTGDLDAALELLAEQQRICREIGNDLGLKVSLHNLARILRKRGDLDGALALLEEQEQFAREHHGATDLLAQVLGLQALVIADRGDLARALNLHREEERLLREAGNAVGLQFSLGNQALHLRRLGHIDAALDLMVKQEAMARKYGIPAGLQQVLGNRAWILSHGGDPDAALELLAQQEEICRLAGLRDSLPNALASQAAVLSKQGEYEPALERLAEAEQISRELGTVAHTQHLLGNRAAILIERGELDEALVQVEERERIARELESPSILQAAIGQRVVILQMRGDLDAALELSAQQEQICRALNDPSGLQLTLGNRGSLLRQTGRLDEALAAYREQETICRQLHDLEGLAQALGNRATALHDRGAQDKALALLSEVEHIARQLGSPAIRQFVLGNTAAILIDAKQLDRAMPLLEEQEQICRAVGNADGLRLALTNRLEVLWQRGTLDHAQPLAEEILRICRRLGHQRATAEMLGRLGTLLLSSEAHEQALARYVEQARFYDDLQDRAGAVTAQLNQAIALAHLGRGEEAVAVARSAREQASRDGLTELASQARSVHRRTRLVRAIGRLGPGQPR